MSPRPPRWRRSPPRTAWSSRAQHLATEVGVDVLQGRRQRGRRRGRGRLRAGGRLPGGRQPRRRRLHDASSSPTAARPSSISARRRRWPRPPTCTSTPTATSSRASSTNGHLAVGVPGTVSGPGARAREVRHDEARRADRAGDRAAPSSGFVLDQGDVDMFATATEDFRKDPATAAIFLNKRRARSPVGQRLVQKDLGADAAADQRRTARTASTRARSARRSSPRARPARASSRRPTSTSTRRASWRRSSATTAATASSRRRRRARAA